MKLIADVNFDMSYSFIFSARPGTPAADMVDDVPEEEKNSACIFCKSVLTSKLWLEPSHGRHDPAHSG